MEKIPFEFYDLVRAGVVLIALLGFYEGIMKIVGKITARHDREKKWDEASTKLKEDQEEIVCKYNEQLADIRREQQDIKTDFEAKVQEIRAEQYILTDCMRAVLDGLHQLKCNGRVTEAIENLDDYLNARAHK